MRVLYYQIARVTLQSLTTNTEAERMSNELNRLVRDALLVEAPAEFNGRSMVQWLTQRRYIDGRLNSMTNVELLERISDALELIRKGDPRA
jgi:hypothetical protein